jgi:oligopeptide/dipeptide ABC transporter ATP-binding protein
VTVATNQTLRRFVRQPVAVGATAVLLALTIATIVVPVVWPYPYTMLTDSLNKAPSLSHPLGTDTLGHDMLAVTMRGLLQSLKIAGTVTLVACFIGTVVGLLSGYFGKRTDMVLMRFTDLVMTIPMVALAGFLANSSGRLPGPQWLQIALVLALVIWPWPARLVRAETIRLRKQEFVQVARASGLATRRILLRHILPNCISQILVVVSIMIAVAILAESGLSFIGLGIQPPDVSLGVLVAQGQSQIVSSPWLFYPPGLLIVLIALCANFIGEGLRQAADPRARSVGAVGLRPARLLKDGPAGSPAPAGPRDTAAGAPPPVLQISHLSVRTDRGDWIVRDVSLDVRPGEILAIVGESGAGKSTVANAILGTLPRTIKVGGSIRVGGDEVVGKRFRELRRFRGRRIGTILQDPMTSLNPVMRIGVQLREALFTRPSDRGETRRRLERSLADVGIVNPARCLDQFPHELSGGMKQRACIAMAIGNSPGLLIADEPTTALDVTIQAAVIELLRDYCESRGMGMVFITHDMGLVAEIADRVAVMYAGRVVEVGTADELFYSSAMPYSKALLGAVPRVDVRRARLTTIARRVGDTEVLAAGGCPFAPRCTVRFDACSEEPPLFEVDGAHLAACWHAKEPSALAGARQ